MNKEMKKQKIAYGFKEDKDWTVEDMVEFTLTCRKPVNKESHKEECIIEVQNKNLS